MPGNSFAGPLPPLTVDERKISEGVQTHVRILAGDIGERNVWRRGSLAASAHYIEGRFREAGCRVTRQEFGVNGMVVANIEATVDGSPTGDEVLVIGAHYDSVAGSPGANDNASGTAALLELARLLSGPQRLRAIRLVAFVNEEPPFFRTRFMGSRVYAAGARMRGEHVAAMLSLETIGCFSDKPGSQKYPFPFGLFYPSCGNFIGFVGNIASRSLVHRSIGSFRQHTSFPSEGLSAPGWMAGVGWSDHWSFWREGFPAVMITDTALFRDPFYHTRDDTPDKLDFASVARVVSGLHRLTIELAGLPVPP